MPARITAEQTRSEEKDAISSQSNQYSSSEEIEVEAILAEKTEDGRMLYLISWRAIQKRNQPGKQKRTSALIFLISGKRRRSDKWRIARNRLM
jgi:hypothetical protein